MQIAIIIKRVPFEASIIMGAACMLEKDCGFCAVLNLLHGLIKRPAIMRPMCFIRHLLINRHSAVFRVYFKLM